jgi:hypothetical protein
MFKLIYIAIISLGLFGLVDIIHIFLLGN